MRFDLRRKLVRYAEEDGVDPAAEEFECQGKTIRKWLRCRPESGRRRESLQERPLPTEADVEAVVSERLTALLEARIRSRDKLHAERAMRFLPLVRSLMETEDESALIAMLLDDYYQESLHAPAPQAEEEPPPRRSGKPGAGKPDENRGEKRERGPSQRPSGEKRERGRPRRRLK